MASFARAAELLKYTWPGWDAAGVEGPFIDWVNRVMMPALTNESILCYLPLANWHATVAGGRCMRRLLLVCVATWASLRQRHGRPHAVWLMYLAWWESSWLMCRLLRSVCAEAKGILAIFIGNLDLWSDALALWTQVSTAVRGLQLQLGNEPADCCHSPAGASQ